MMDRITELERQLATVTAQRDAYQAAMTEEMAENIKLFNLLGVMPEIQRGTAGTEAVIRAIRNLKMLIANLQETVEHKP